MQDGTPRGAVSEYIAYVTRTCDDCGTPYKAKVGAQGHTVTVRLLCAECTPWTWKIRDWIYSHF